MVRENEQGQGLLEFALVLPLLLFLVIGLVELGIMGWNYAASRIIVGQAVDEATAFKADGTHTCYQNVMDRAFGAFSGPYLLNVAPENWTLEVLPCPDDPSWSPSTDQEITATLDWKQDGIFYFDVLPFRSRIIDEAY